MTAQAATDRPGALFLVLLAMGASWGLSGPMAKIAVMGGLEPFGIVFWQMLLGALLLVGINAARGKRLPLSRGAISLYLFIALMGTLVPNTASYAATRHLPAGIMAIVISATPLLAFPIALGLREERASLARMLGLCLGIGGVALIALPSSSLPVPGSAIWLPLALVAPLCYAIEANGVARLSGSGPDPLQALEGGCLIGAALGLPLALWTGEFIDPFAPWGAPEAAVVGIALSNALIYSAYVWTVARAGAVFGAQVAYLVTGFGVLWSMLLLGERYSLWVWFGLGLMLTGLLLVQPKGRDTLPANGPPPGELTKEL